MNTSDIQSYSFESFTLKPLERQLFDSDRLLALTPKAFDVLTFLLANAGHLVTKAELLEAVWAESFVEEANLARLIHTIRKTLGQDETGTKFIETVPTKGYRFVPYVKEIFVRPREDKDADQQETFWSDRSESPAPAGGQAETNLAPKFEFKFTDPDFCESHADLFVGRGPELKRLDGYLHQAVEANGQLVFITGEPGIGKTTLATEFRRRMRDEDKGFILGYGRCLEQYGPGEAYLPFLDAFSALLNSPDREFIMATLKTHAPTWCLQFPAEFGRTGVFEQLQRETMGATKERMLREMSDALGAMAVRSPVVLLLEDLHWADPSSIDLLKYLCQRFTGRRLLIVGLLRPEDLEVGNHPLKNYRREMRVRKLCEEIALDSLKAEHISQYLDARFAPNDFSHALAEMLERKTEGHPLFATSLVDLFVELGDIADLKGRWTLTRQLAEMDVEAPEKVYSIIRKKIDALDGSELRVLQYASIEGGEFLSSVAAELLGVDDLALEEQLNRIGRLHKLVHALGEEELPNGLLAIRYRFSHVLYQNFLYSELATKRRIALHRQAGELLLKFYGTSAPRFATQLATHFERGRDFARAIDYLVHAADNATKIFANSEAEQHISHALRLVERLLPEEQIEKYIALHHKRGIINQVLSRFDQAVDDFTQMLELARSHGLQDREHMALNAMGTTLFWAHRMQEMSVRIDEVARVAEASDNVPLKLETMVITALRHQCYGELAETKPLYDEVIRVARSIDHKPALLSALTWRGFVYFFQSEYERAEVLLREARGLATELRDGFRLLNCLFCLGMVLGNRGRISEALDTFNEAVEMAGRNGDHAVRAKLPNCLGWIHRELQDFEGARRYDESGVEVAREDHITEAEAHSLINLGNHHSLNGESETPLAAFREAETVFGRDDWLRWRFDIRHQAGQAEYWLAQADLERAEECARLLLETATLHGVHKYIAVACTLLGEVASARGTFLEAESEFSKALDEFRDYPAPLVAWRTYAALGRMHSKNNEPDDARKAYRQAGTIIRDIASNVNGELLRTTFLDSPKISDVLSLSR